MSPIGHSRASKASRAAAGEDDPRMMRTTSSRLLTATTRPSKMCARSRALASSNLQRRVITSSRKGMRSEEHTSELQSLMRNSYAVFCLEKKKTHKQQEK